MVLASTKSFKFDAALDVANKRVSFGMVLRDSGGHFVKGLSKFCLGKYSPLMAEACCFKEALSWIKSLGLSNIIIEMDAKGMVDAFNSFSSDFSEFAAIIGACRKLIDQ